MQVVAVYVLVLEYGIRLVAVAELFEVFSGDGRQFRIVEAVVGVRIQGDMHDGFRGSHLRRHTACEVLRRLPYVECSRAVVENLVRQKQPSLPLVHLLPAVRQSPVKGASYTDFGNHRC